MLMLVSVPPAPIMVEAAVTDAPTSVPPASRKKPPASFRVVLSVMEPPDSTRVLPPLMVMLWTASPPGVLLLLWATVWPLPIWTSSSASGVCPRLQFATADQSPSPPIQTLVAAGTMRSSSNSRRGTSRRGAARRGRLARCTFCNPDHLRSESSHMANLGSVVRKPTLRRAR